MLMKYIRLRSFYGLLFDCGRNVCMTTEEIRSLSAWWSIQAPVDYYEFE